MISDQYRCVGVTNDRKQLRVPNLKYGGRLSAKAMHDLVVESLYPCRRKVVSEVEIGKGVRRAVSSAKRRIKEYKIMESRPRTRPVTPNLLPSRRSSSAY